jgi:hypothetical protein
MTAVLPPEAELEAIRAKRETLTMGLYVSITLLAALTVTGAAASHLDVIAIIWGTTLGLAVAHWFAFDLALRLVDPKGEHRYLNRDLWAALLAALLVGAVATVPVLLLPDDLELAGARVGTAACIGVVTYNETRTYGASRGRALAAAGIALAIGLTVAGVKHALGH